MFLFAVEYVFDLNGNRVFWLFFYKMQFRPKYTSYAKEWTVSHLCSASMCTSRIHSGRKVDVTTELTNSYTPLEY